MVDFTKLAQGQKRGGEPLVTNSNVFDGSELFKTFDQKMSRINLDGFDGNMRPTNLLDSQSKVQVQPGNYLAALDKAEIRQNSSDIEIGLDYIRQNEQYIQYQQHIKQLLRETDCKNIGELLSKHGDSKKVIAAMSTLQKTFDADPKLKKHYQNTLADFKSLNNKCNDLRSHIHRGSATGALAIQNIAKSEFDGNVSNAVTSYQADMSELKDMRNEAIHNINETMIPFVDGHGKYVVSDFENDLQVDQTYINQVSEIDVNKPEPISEFNVESTETPPKSRDKTHEHEIAGPSL